MARYTGPKAKIARRFNDPILGASKALQKKAYPPGQHGRGRKKKSSEYAVQLMAKQKAKYTYGILEKQFSNLFQKAVRQDGITGENLLKLLEARLDNVVSHKHVTVNGQIVNIPSYTVKAGDVIAVRAKSQKIEGIAESLTVRTNQYSWLEWDESILAGKYIMNPDRSEIPENIQEQLIVELYSK